MREKSNDERHYKKKNLGHFMRQTPKKLLKIIFKGKRLLRVYKRKIKFENRDKTVLSCLLKALKKDLREKITTNIYIFVQFNIFLPYL